MMSDPDFRPIGNSGDIILNSPILRCPGLRSRLLAGERSAEPLLQARREGVCQGAVNYVLCPRNSHGGAQCQRFAVSLKDFMKPSISAVLPLGPFRNGGLRIALTAL